MMSMSGRHSARDSKGFTLIELTVVLAVIVTLALVLTPSITNFINDSRVARSRSDTTTLSAAITTFWRDTGFYPQWTASNAGGPGLPANKVDLLVSQGNIPAVGAPNLWTTGSTDLLENQLVANAPAYTTKTSTSPFGWNGPYITNTINADPWNNRYMVNIGLQESTQGTQGAGGATKSAVWVVSAGANGIIETAYTQAMTVAVIGGDDIGIRLQ
jgi:prepilin-type N-terminal cleavage/methylation domain-containing protein